MTSAAAASACRFRRAGLKTWIPVVFFAVVVCLSFFTTWQATQYCLDGDASSELVLAHHLNETGKLLARDWYYSSELRVLNTNLIFAPLFSVFSDWHMVRFTGAMIMQALLVLSFFYLCRQAKLSMGARFLGGSLLLLPFCVTYGRNVLYQTFYMPHLTFGFLIVALYLAMMKHLEASRKAQSAIRFLLLLALSFGTGLGGPRQIIITHGPLMLVLLILLYQDAKDKPVSAVIRAHLPKILLMGIALCAFVAGYFVNIRYLLSRYSFDEFHNLTTNLRNPEALEAILFALLHSFGYRKGIRILSLLGILSASAVFSCICCLSRSIHLLKNKESDRSPERRMLSLFPLCALFVMLCVFVFINDHWFYILYIIPVTVWFIPMIAAHYDAMPEHPARLMRADVCMLLSIVFLAGNGLANAAYFATNGQVFSQTYEGQHFSDIQLAKKLETPVSYLIENDYELGYAEFWYSNPVTEISDGKLTMINMLINQYNRPLVRYEFLMQPSVFDRQADKVFLLLTQYHNRAYATMPYEDKGELVYQDENFVIYHFDDPELIRDYTSWEYPVN